MENKNSTKRLASYACLALFAILCILTLAFSTIHAKNELAEFGNFKPDNGFKWMLFDTEWLESDIWDVAKIPIGIISIAQLLFGIYAVISVANNFLKGNDNSNKKTIIIGLISMAWYAIEGIVVKIVFCDEVGYGMEDFIGTSSFYPVIIGAALIAIYYAIDKNLGENSTASLSGANNAPTHASAKPQAPILTEAEKIESLAKYNELLEKGIISQEEFDTKKKQLLGL